MKLFLFKQNLAQAVFARSVIMKINLCFFFILIVSVHVSASSYAQKVNMKEKNISLDKIFNEIKAQTGYSFVYSSGKIKSIHTNINVNDASLEATLNSLFKNLPFSYKVVKTNILIKEDLNKVYGAKLPENHKKVVSNRAHIQTQIQGRIVDAQGQPLVGATVAIKDSETNVLTDEQGSFSINESPQGKILQISYIGFLPLEIAASTSFQEITLQEDIQDLSEVVIIGYGTQRKENLTGSISVVDGESLESRPITSASQALQGVQGVYVNQAGGQPGADGATIRIRGVGTLGGASKLNPLVMVDGVEYSLDAVNPNDIESISVLKDAASTAIYGSRAANGVILVTTKKGKAGRTSIEYNNYFGVQNVTYLPDPVSNSVDFLEAYNTAMVNAGSPKYYTDELINEFRNNPTSLEYPNTNWMDVMFDSAPIQEHNIRFSGGSEKMNFNLSLAYLNQNGVLKGTSADKISVNLRASSQLTDRFSIDGAIMGTVRKNDDNVGGISTAMNRLMRMVPIQPIGNLENGDWPDSWVLTPGQNSFDNPLIRSTQGFRHDKRNNILGSLSLKYKILEGLDFESKGAVNFSDLLQEEFTPKIGMNDVRTGEFTRFWSSNSIRTSYYSRSPKLTLYNTLTYRKEFNDDHGLVALAGQSYEELESIWFDAQIRGFTSNELTELNLGSVDQRARGTTSDTNVLLSYFGRVQYSYKDKYLLESNFRYDGSSNFGMDYRWGFFPSFSLGWRLEQENFLKDISWVNALKIRGSWGQIGNQDIGRFQYIDAVSLGVDYAFGGAIAPGAAITQSKDPAISWETTTIRNLGLDWNLFGSKLNGVVEVFHKRTDGVLRTINLPAQVGDLQGPTRNIAVVDNTGFEIALDHRNNISDDISYEIGAHLTKITNEVVDTKGEIIYGTNTITQEGSPINAWYVYKTDGLFQSQAEVDSYPTYSSRVGPGDVKYVDIDQNGEINGDDRYVAGSSFPDFTYGFNLGITIKGVSLVTFWQGVSGIDVYPDFNLASPFNNGAGLEKKWLTDAWTPENTSASLPRLTSRNQYAENFQPSDFWLQDASYLRLKNIQISYPFTGGILNKIGIKQLRVFANAQNILTFSKFDQFDPERNTLQTNLSEYPSVKMVTAGININL